MTAKTLANDLLERARQSDELTVDGLLALLAYSAHGDHDLLIEAREQGALVGTIDHAAWRLRKRSVEGLSG